MMPANHFLADARRVVHALLSNQLAKASPALYAHLTRQTGRGFAPESPQQVADYFQACFADYFDILGVPAAGIAGYLQHKQLLEYGPGDVPGVALLLVAHGAERVTCVDRFPLVSMSAKNVAILRELLARLQNDARARAEQCFRQPGDPASGFDPQRIRYLIQPSGLAGLEGGIDLILSRAVLEHVNDLQATFDDMARALQPGGIILHQVDLKSHGLHRRNPLDFLTWSPTLWAWMHSHKGVPNRWRVDRYRDAMQHSGFETLLLQPTKLADLTVVQEVRPYLAHPFQALSDVDLSWLGFWLMGRKIAAGGPNTCAR